MNFPFFIAKRYLVSKKKRNIINIISAIAVTGVAVGTIALVVVLSVYNGFDSLIHSMFNSFDPDLKITAVEGKTFNPDKINLQEINKIRGVAYVSQVLEEGAILKYGQAHGIVTIKGVSSDYDRVTNLDSLIYDGQPYFEKDGIPYAIVGLGVAVNWGIRLNFTDPMDIYAAKKGERVSMNLANSLNHERIFPSAIFSVQEEYDSKYVLVPLNFARTLFDTPENISALEIKLAPGADLKTVQEKIRSVTGQAYSVKNKIQQQELIYKVMNSEKWAIYFILVFILVVASFNILGSISMLIIDKKDDIAILKSMGANQKTIKKTFLFEGWLITLTGSVIGLVAGILICWIQIHYQILKFPENASFAVPAYPVVIKASGLVLTFFTVIIIGFAASWIPIRYISGKYITLSHS